MNDESIRNRPGHTAGDQIKVLVREMPADLETPVSAFLKLREYGARVLLESVESGTILGRYSFIGIRPDSKIIVNQNDIILRNNGDREVLPHDGGQDVLNKIKEILDR
jgi:anthranilate synthase component 1